MITANHCVINYNVIPNVVRTHNRKRKKVYIPAATLLFFKLAVVNSHLFNYNVNRQTIISVETFPKIMATLTLKMKQNITSTKETKWLTFFWCGNSRNLLWDVERNSSHMAVIEARLFKFEFREFNFFKLLFQILSFIFTWALAFRIAWILRQCHLRLEPYRMDCLQLWNDKKISEFVRPPSQILTIY